MTVDAERLAAALLEATNSIIQLNAALADERKKSDMFFQDALDARLEADALRKKIQEIEGCESSGVCM